MRNLAFTAAAWALLAGPVLAQSTPPAPTSNAGARPGNEIGTNNSLPTGTTASNINPSDTKSTIAPRLPQPPGADSSNPRSLLEVARKSLNNGRTGEAQQALEMAQTRLLDRVVAQSQINQPDNSPAVTDISGALQALGSHNKHQAAQMIDSAMAKLGS